MKLVIEGTPEDIKMVFQAIKSSEEHSYSKMINAIKNDVENLLNLK